MKIAIISDIHDNLVNLERFLVLAKELKIKSIICCGDVTTPETLEFLVTGFNGTIKLVCGNAEIKREEFFELAKKYQNLEVFPEIGEWKISRAVLDIIKIAFVHRPDRIEELGETGKYNFIFYGHTHEPWIKEVKGAIIANPGTLGGGSTIPTFVFWDSKTGRLKLTKLY